MARDKIAKALFKADRAKGRALFKADRAKGRALLKADEKRAKELKKKYPGAKKFLFGRW